MSMLSSPEPAPSFHLPPAQLNKLPPREREVADIVYRRGQARASDIVRALCGVSNSAVRVMLGRLEKKGFLWRRRVGPVYYYAPAGREHKIVTHIQRLADDHFEGSLLQAALKIMEMLEARQPGSAARLASRYQFHRN
jgi:predicted transcriptional regulator